MFLDFGVFEDNLRGIVSLVNELCCHSRVYYCAQMHWLVLNCLGQHDKIWLGISVLKAKSLDLFFFSFFMGDQGIRNLQFF